MISNKVEKLWSLVTMATLVIFNNSGDIVNSTHCGSEFQMRTDQIRVFLGNIWIYSTR